MRGKGGYVGTDGIPRLNVLDLQVSLHLSAPFYSSYNPVNWATAACKALLHDSSMPPLHFSQPYKFPRLDSPVFLPFGITLPA